MPLELLRLGCLVLPAAVYKTIACVKKLILSQVLLLMPAGHRLEFLIQNTNQYDLKPWIS